MNPLRMKVGLKSSLGPIIPADVLANLLLTVTLPQGKGGLNRANALVSSISTHGRTMNVSSGIQSWPVKL